MSQQEGLYLYCIIRSSSPVIFGHFGIGGRGDEVTTVEYDGICAVVSRAPLMKYDASRENMIAHEMVIETVMKEYSVLPLRFATVVENESDVIGLLKEKYDRFVDGLDFVKGKVELGIKAIAKKDIVFDDILQNYEEVRRLKKKIEGMPHDQAYYEHIEIGKKVEEALELEKEKYRKAILDALGPVALEIKENNCFGDRMIVNAAFFVDAKREPEFDSRVNELADQYGDKVIFKYVGGLPPYSFVNLSL